MDKRAQISCFHPSREIVYHSDTCIIYLTVRETENFTEYPTHARTVVPRPFFPSPAKKRPGNEARFILLPLLPLGAKSANHTFLPLLPLGAKKRKSHDSYFATFSAWRKKRKSHDSYFCHFCRLAQKAQIILFLPLLPLGAKSAIPMIHTFATFAAWRKKRKSHDSYFCHFCRLAQKAQIP